MNEEYEIVNIDTSNDMVAYADLKNGAQLSIARNGLARYNGEIVNNYSTIINNVAIKTLFEALALEVSKQNN